MSASATASARNEEVRRLGAPRREALALYLRTRGARGATVTQIWDWGTEWYVGGDAPLIKDDLRALCGSGRARRHDGFWRTSDPRLSLQWGDYWTAR